MLVKVSGFSKIWRFRRDFSKKPKITNSMQMQYQKQLLKFLMQYLGTHVINN